ncbi:4'-phosphopantetheinyl transferase superfamily protein (plasmid) [Streptomyces sp. NBC_00536]|uniref:4'-phosphopantetheinyl transferase family protein n=1 Tax=Streptomyces sp. NBC_00536 TaxID=2975769 RepID=UPI002E8202B3|nr:4'-phosphopantetheinyl transferase superfamily protein [Streptomyces sp. NBC_00536]WUC84300.1 4'-phosphopantetheinyl transferase superfamily protein [Streptomyces sp. NBC_00536]
MGTPLRTRLTLPRALADSRPREPGLGFGTCSVHEGPPVAVREAERRMAKDMPPRRRADFLIGRGALHRALRAAGLTADAVLFEGSRPLLPAGISASISHSDGVAVAVAGPSERFSSLGVDLELTGPPLRAAHLVLRGAETAALHEAGDAAEQRLLAMYSAKEAAYKALSPHLGPELRGLRDLLLTADADGFLAHAPSRPALRLRVSVRKLPRGVLCWALPLGTPTAS